MNKYEIPIWEKYALTLGEAALYFGIGENKIREIIEMDHTNNFVLMIGNRVKIKRKAFETYLDDITCV